MAMFQDRGCAPVRAGQPLLWVPSSLWTSLRGVQLPFGLPGSVSPSMMDVVLGPLRDVSSVFSVQQELKLVVFNAAAMLSATSGKVPFARPRPLFQPFVPLPAALLEFAALPRVGWSCGVTRHPLRS